MELFSILCFVTLARCSKFFEAAEKLHISQSSFSKHIQALERTLGADLFVRHPHGSALTAAGMAFLPYAEAIIQEYEKAGHLIDAYKKSYKHRLVVYTHSFLVHYNLSEMLLCFQDTHANAQLEINELDSRLAIQHVQDNPAYVSIVFSEPDAAIEQLDRHILLYDALVLLASRQHPIAVHDRIHISLLRNEKLQIMLKEQEPFLSAFILKQCKKAGFSPKLSPHGLWISTIRELLLRENLVSVIPRRIAESICTPDLKILDLEGAEPLSIQVVKNKKSVSDIVNRFYEFTKLYAFSDT